MAQRRCRCGKHMLESVNEGSCLWCGHGEVAIRPTIALAPLARVPRDLQSLVAEGRRPRRGVRYVPHLAEAA